MVEGDVASVKVWGDGGGIGLSFAPTRHAYRETGLGSPSLGMTKAPTVDASLPRAPRYTCPRKVSRLTPRAPGEIQHHTAEQETYFHRRTPNGDISEQLRSPDSTLEPTHHDAKSPRNFTPQPSPSTATRTLRSSTCRETTE